MIIMDNSKKLSTIDPDYQSYNTALELNEEEETNTKLNKIRKIIGEVYDQEIANKFEQTKQITLQICKVRKLLDLLRNVAIKSYYNKKELEYNGAEEDINLDILAVPDKQNRIHPAVKKLLGNNTANLSNLYIKNKRKRNNNSGGSSNEIEKSNEPLIKVIKTEPINLSMESGSTGSLLLPENDNISKITEDVASTAIKRRNKVKKRIVIGNSSRSVPTTENSILTRKWMVYVQGSRQQEDVSSFIEKVIFYLHPSYKPYDVVEVSRHPIHLQRPGWGEFKIKLEIFFKNKLNKPVTLEHDIKFKDHRFNGRETLGSETIVDLYIYEDVNDNIKTEIDSIEDLPKYINHIDNSLLKIEDEYNIISIDEIDIKEEIIDDKNDPSLKLEHDYCFGNSNDNSNFFDSFSIEHNYSLPSSEESNPNSVLKKRKSSLSENIDPNNSLIYGLDQSYLDPPKELGAVNSLQTEKILIPLNELNDFLQVHKKDIKFNNAKIIILNKKIDGLENYPKLNHIANAAAAAAAATITTEKPDIKLYNLKINLPENRFKSVGEALPFLFKRLPLISELANNPIYKRHFPFTAPSLEVYNSWNIGKRRSAEWSLAKKIKNILKTGKIYCVDKWSTKAILMYGRSHCFIPSTIYGLFTRESMEKQLIMNCFAKSDPNVQKFNKNNSIIEEDDIDIDVSNIDTKKSPIKNKYSKSLMDISNPELRHHCSYIRETALNCNVVLKPEEVVDGVVMNMAERMMLEAVKCLADNLIRRAHNYKVCQNKPNFNYLNVEDVQRAIDERPEILTILQFKNKKRDLERYF